MEQCTAFIMLEQHTVQIYLVQSIVCGSLVALCIPGEAMAPIREFNGSVVREGHNKHPYSQSYM